MTFSGADNITRCDTNLREESFSKWKSYWIRLAYGLKIFVWIMALVPLVVVPGGIYLRIDPFSFTFQKLLPASSICVKNTESCTSILKILVVLLRIFCATICVVEACRFFPLYFLQLLYHLELRLKAVEILNRLVPGPVLDSECNVLRYRRFLNCYSLLELSENILEGTISTLVAILMGDGFVIFVVCNLATIRCFNILPLLIYWLMPTVSLVCLFFVFCLLQITVGSSSEYANVIEKVRKSFSVDKKELRNSLNIKIIKRKIRNLKPVYASCGRFYKLRRGTETDFYFQVFVRTVDGILLPIWQN